LADRAALVTGASSGIGLAIARALGEDGYALTISARRPQKLEDAAEALRGEGLEVHSVPAQMAEEDDVVGLVAAHRDKYGRMDVLVNNAGIGVGQAMERDQYQAPRSAARRQPALADASPRGSHCRC